MRDNFDKLDRSQETRIVIFTIITIIAAVLVVACVWDWFRLCEDPPINTDDMYVDMDGENVTWFFSSLAYVINGGLILINTVIYVVLLLTVDSLAYGLFRAIAFQKADFASEAEYILAKQVLVVILTIILIVSIVISLFMGRFSFLIFVALLVFPIWLFGYLLYILPLKHRRHKIDSK